mmetsp:Transcript_55340/g.80840  ORF Transcript_55340/g.80840 Transcript_55340/m.80840 type:complete len:230 (+) Transcript_55340:40-729(+)
MLKIKILVFLTVILVGNSFHIVFDPRVPMHLTGGHILRHHHHWKGIRPSEIRRFINLKSSGDSSSAEYDDEKTAKSLCTVKFRNESVEVERGQLLRTALLRNGLSPHNGKAKLINCRGLGTCGTCAVQIKGRVRPAARTPVEEARLSLPPFAAADAAHLRLACRCRVDGDLEVAKFGRFWGQGTEPATDKDKGEFWAPFGEFEYLLDMEGQPAATLALDGDDNTDNNRS